MRRRVWISAAIALGCLPLLLSIALRLGSATPFVNLALKKELGGIFNGEVRFGSFRTDLFSYVEIDDLLVLTMHGKAHVPVLTAGQIRLNYDGWELLRGHRSLEDAVQLVSLHSMHVFLLRDKQGHWNLRQILRLPGGKARKAAESGGGASHLPALATRLVLEDSVLVFNDERKDFQSTIGNLEGTLDARAYPLVAFSLSGRTEEQTHDNLSFAGEWNAEEESLYARADLALVPLKTYLNYALPAGGLQFLGGSTSLSVRIRQNSTDKDPRFEGRANVHDGSLAIPGITDPLTNFQGNIFFGDNIFKVDGVKADFLGSSWLASGELTSLRSPVLNLSLQNSAVALNPLSEQIHGLHVLALSGTASLAVTVTGRAADPIATGQLLTPQMELAGISLEDVNANVRLTKKGLQVSSLTGKLWKGTVLGSADIAFANKKLGPALGMIEGKFNAKNVDLSSIRYRGVEYLPLTGTASMESNVKGPLRNPLVDAQFDCPAAYFGYHALGRLHLDASVTGRNLQLKLLTWNNKLDANVGFSFQKDKPAEFVDSAVRLHHFQIDDLMAAISKAPDTALIHSALRAKMQAALKRYSGNADIELGLSGPVRGPYMSLNILKHQGRLLNPEGLWATVDPKGIAFSTKGMIRLGVGGLSFGLGKDPFIITVAGPGKGAEIGLLGRLPLKSRQIGADEGLGVSLTADLKLLDVLQIFQKSSGVAKMDLLLQGSYHSIMASGSMQVKNLNSDMSQFFPTLRKGQLEAHVVGQVLTLDNLSFESGGKVQIGGKLNFISSLLPTGSLEARTDDDGLKIGSLSYGNLNVALQPLSLGFLGENGLNVGGKIILHDSEIFVPKPKPKPQEDTVPVVQTGTPYPLSFDLLAQIDANVWVKKVEESVEFSDPITMLKNAFNSAQETLLSPTFEFLFKPTQADFVIKGPLAELKVKGDLGIDRGTLIFMENEFQIVQQDEENHIVFDGYRGKRGDVTAEASAPIRYVEEVQGKIQPKTVVITVNISPMNEEDLVAAGLENTLLNYNNLTFSSDPPLSDDPSQERQAILSLLVLGDPGSQATYGEIQNSGAPTTTGADPGQLLSIQASRLISGQMRKFINQYAKVYGKQLFDYIRLTPRVRYQGTSDAIVSAAGPQAVGVSQQVQQEGFQVSWLLELGRSITKNLFGTSQLVYFGDDDIQAVRDESLNPSDQAIYSWGATVGAEYRFTSTRMAELKYMYDTDDDLDPVVFDPDALGGGGEVIFDLRNTLPMDNYSPRIAHMRHLDALQAKGVSE